MPSGARSASIGRSMSEPLLSVDGLTTGFDSAGRFVPAVIDVSFHLDQGETLCLVGESGSGKSLTAFSMLGLVQPPGRIDRGRVVFKGRDLLRLPEREMQKVRGAEIALVFQEPMTALNPVFTIGSQIEETLRVHGRATRRTARARAIELLEAVQVPEPSTRVRDYPHQLSGGLRQRALIAMALACNPVVLIADEPTTALDVTIQRADPRAAARSSEAAGARAAADHARPRCRGGTGRPRGGDVRRAHCRGVRGRRSLRGPEAPLHAWLARIDPRRRAWDAARRDCRDRSRSGDVATGLRLRPSLPLALRALRDRPPGRHQFRWRPYGEVLSARAGGRA